MKNGSPKLRLRPNPPRTSSGENLARLEMLEEWTEEPARLAAQALAWEGAAVESAEPKEAQTPDSEAKPIKKPARAAAEPAKENYPWSACRDEEVRQVNLRLPARLALQLKFLGETTYGSSMNKIATESIQATVKKMLSERGIK